MFRLAMVIDKYGCAESVHLQIKALLHASTCRLSRSDVYITYGIIAASYILDQSESFELATSTLVTNTKSSLLVPVRREYTEMLPETLPCACYRTTCPLTK